MSKTKSTERASKRIYEKVLSGELDAAGIQHMIDSIVANRDKRIEFLTKKVRPREFRMTRATITGALRDTINQHGPVTTALLESATKRIYRDCFRVISVESKDE